MLAHASAHSIRDKKLAVKNFLRNFTLGDSRRRTKIEFIEIPGRDGQKFPKYINEYWTSKQRQACSLHEIAYRACFKGQLPGFFITLLTEPGHTVYDPFAGRGTTPIQAALLNRHVIANDRNPISAILTRPRLRVPDIAIVQERLDKIPIDKKAKADLDLSMFYHRETEAELVSLRDYLREKKYAGREDHTDEWIRMVATNRLTGHSSGFFSVYTLPPNQAITQKKQIKINKAHNQTPLHRDVKSRILKKTKSLHRDLSDKMQSQLRDIAKQALFLTNDARSTPTIPDETVHLTVTSPPFLDVVRYADDNWLRCWFNDVDLTEVEKNLTVTKSLKEWRGIMGHTLKELYRVTKKRGWVAFEVGEIRNGKIKLEEYIIPLGIRAGFACEGVAINRQNFTKTSHIWGVKNNKKGTNSNRISLFFKE